MDTLTVLDPQREIFCARITDDEHKIFELGLELQPLRYIIDQISVEHFSLYSQGLQLLNAIDHQQFCNRCGALNKKLLDSAIMHCSQCHTDHYPVISPCIMALICRGEYCLLAHHIRSQKPVYTALAGFVEPGETLEQTLHREVKEEVGFTVDNLRYFSSQSWPFPSQLMIAFLADYQSGSLALDQSELHHADWFHYKELPMIPSTGTLSGQLIRYFVESCEKK